MRERRVSAVDDGNARSRKRICASARLSALSAGRWRRRRAIIAQRDMGRNMAELKRHRGGDFAAAEELWRGRAMRKPRETAAFRI